MVSIDNDYLTVWAEEGFVLSPEYTEKIRSFGVPAGIYLSGGTAYIMLHGLHLLPRRKTLKSLEDNYNKVLNAIGIIKEI